MLKFTEIHKFLNDSRTKLDDIINESMFSDKAKADELFSTHKSLKPIKIDNDKLLKIVEHIKLERRDKPSHDQN